MCGGLTKRAVTLASVLEMHTSGRTKYTRVYMETRFCPGISV